MSAVRAEEAAPPPLPRLLIVGPLVGRHHGHVTTQGEILARLLAAAGYPVRAASFHLNRYRRLLDIVWTILRRRGEIDMLLIQTYGGPSFVVEDVASALARALGKRVLLHLRGGALPEFFAKNPRWSRRVLSRADALVVPSDYLRRAVESLGFAASVVPNVIELSTYPFRPRSPLRPRLLWMRTFHPIYHPEMALAVLERVRSRFPEASLVLAGEEKGLGPSLRRLTDELGLAEAVRFAGFLDAAGKRREGSAADIFLNTNRVDNQPVSVIEACAMGLPVVATAVGGVADLLTDGETGLLVPDGDADAMAAAVCRLLEDPPLATRLSRNGRALAERSAPERVLEQWREILADRPGPRAGDRG